MLKMLLQRKLVKFCQDFMVDQKIKDVTVTEEPGVLVLHLNNNVDVAVEIMPEQNLEVVQELPQTTFKLDTSVVDEKAELAKMIKTHVSDLNRFLNAADKSGLQVHLQAGANNRIEAIVTETKRY